MNTHPVKRTVELESAARRAGIDELRLEASRSSVPFYEARGYVALPEERLVVGDAEFRFIPMRRSLTTPSS